MNSTGAHQGQPTTRLIKSPQDFAGGLLIIAVAGIALWLGRDLPAGTLGGMGPGMLPRSVAVLLGVLGGVLVLTSLLHWGPETGSWPFRGVLLVLAAILAFAYAVRPLGLVVAAPVALLLSALGSDETRWVETIIFGCIITAFCIGLFKYALGLPIPLAPWLVGY